MSKRAASSVPPGPKVSAVLCTFNEGDCLDACLSSLAWADECVVCDMGSTDRTLAVAARHGATVRSVAKVDYVERVRQQAVALCAHEWICFVDPDFVFPVAAVAAIKERMVTDPDLTCISMRYVNHYQGRPIWYGRWGARGRYPVIFHRSAMQLPAVLHDGFRLTRGKTWMVPDEHYIRHMWIRDERHFYEKHTKYIRNEGERRLQLGHRPSPWRTSRLVMKMLGCYLGGGFRDGWLGLDLLNKSIWYELESEKMLKAATRSATALRP